MPSSREEVLGRLDVEFSLKNIFACLLDAVLQQHLFHEFGRDPIFLGKSVRDIQHVFRLEVEELPGT